MSRQKEVTINGVVVRLYKLNAFQQKEVVDMLMPHIAYIAGKVQSGVPASSAVAERLSALQPAETTKLMTRYLLHPDHAKQVINGAELAVLTVKDDGSFVTMNDQLGDYLDLLKLEVEAFRFNFERFFTELAGLTGNYSDKPRKGSKVHSS